MREPFEKKFNQLLLENNDSTTYQEWSEEVIISMINQSFAKNEVIFNPDFLKTISRTPVIFDSLFKIISYRKSWLLKDNKYQLTQQENKENLETIFINPVLGLVCQALLSNQTSNKERNNLVIKILNFAWDFNQKQVENLKSIISKKNLLDLNLDENGFVSNQEQVYGNFILISLNVLPDISDEFFKLISEINHLVDELKFNKRFFTDGFSASLVYNQNKKVFKEISNNQIEYQCLTFLNENKFPYAPTYYGQENNNDIFAYFEGKTSYFVEEMPLSSTIQVAKCLKEMHQLSKPKLQGKVYVHDDLSPMNVIFKDQKLVGIIDWDHTKIGDDYEDLIFLCWVWINIGKYPSRDNEQIFKDLLAVIDAYHPEEETKNNFATKMMVLMDKRLANTPLKAINYNRVKQWVEWSQKWVELYREKITKEIG